MRGFARGRVRGGARIDARSVALVAGFCVAVLASACDLPTVDEGRAIAVRISLDGPATAEVGDTIQIIARAEDLAGNRLAAPPLEWEVAGSGWRLTQVVSQDSGTIRLTSMRPDTVRTEAFISPDHPYFRSDTARQVMRSGYVGVEVAFEVDSDTLRIRDHRGFQVAISAITGRGGAVEAGHFTLEARGSGASNARVVGGRVQGYPDANGTDTLFLSHTACTAPCADTLEVVIQQVPDTIRTPLYTPIMSSLGDTLQLHAWVYDEAGDRITDVDLDWRLVDPADTTIIGFVDAHQGLVVARSNGEAEVEVRVGDLSERQLVTVRQAWASARLWGLGPRLYPVGSVDTVTIRGWDARGHVLQPSAPTPTAVEWQVDSAIATVESDGAAAYVTAVDTGITRIWVTFDPCPYGCEPMYASSPVVIMPAFDSIQGITYVDEIPPGSRTPVVMVGWIDDELLIPIHTLWEALDPAVATVDSLSRITAHTVGEARFEGTVDTFVDTVTINVR